MPWRTSRRLRVLWPHSPVVAQRRWSWGFCWSSSSPKLSACVDAAPQGCLRHWELCLELPELLASEWDLGVTTRCEFISRSYGLPKSWHCLPRLGNEVSCLGELLSAASSALPELLVKLHWALLRDEIIKFVRTKLQSQLGASPSLPVRHVVEEPWSGMAQPLL